MRIAQYAHPDVDLQIVSADDDSRKQIEQIKHFINAGVDLLIISPNQVNSIRPVVEEAYDKGIPVILFDRKVNTQKYTAFIGCDNRQIGKTMGEVIASDLNGKGMVVEIEGLQGSSAALQRHEGFMEVMKAHPGIAVISMENAKDWTGPSGKKEMNRLLSNVARLSAGQAIGTPQDDLLKQLQQARLTNANIAVFGHNDRLAMGARDAAEKAGWKNLRYYGVDALPTPGNGIEAVKKGQMQASYIYPTRGNEVIELAMNILHNKPYRRDTPLQAAVITRDNADVMLLQYAEQMRQSENIDRLHALSDQYFKQVNIQRFILIGALFIIALVVLTAYYLYRLTLQKSKLNDELQVANNELKEMIDSRMRFFTNISYELRKPLRQMEEPLRKLLGRYQGSTSLQLIHDNVRKLHQLVDEALDPVVTGEHHDKMAASANTHTSVMEGHTESEFLIRLRAIIREHLDDSQFSVERLGEEMGLSRAQLYRKVKALTGLSPVELFRKARLEQAHHLLQTTEMSISEIAYAVGFSTPGYFSKCYKDEFGVSPGNERQ